jgi:L-amino acid N-acyltransferase YncA
MTMNVRFATIDDVRTVAEIHVASWRAGYRGIIDEDFLAGLDVASREVMWTRSLERDNVRLIVVEDERTILGWAYAGDRRADDLDAAWSEVWAFYVHPDAWGRGAGRAMWRWTMEYLRTRGFRNVYVYVLAENTRAIAFYEAVGLQADGGGKEAVIGGVPYPEVRMSAAL